jgi:hypothetical protein
MGEGFQVDPDQLRQLAARFADFTSEFDSILSASQAISQDDEAYGLLSEWIPAILEGRHQAYDEMVRYGQENMELLSGAITGTANSYESADDDAALDFEALGESLE